MKLRPTHTDRPIWAKLSKSLSKVKGDDNGAITVMAAGVLVFAWPVGSVAIDAGMMIPTKRSLQNKVDAAAMAAVSAGPEGRDQSCRPRNQTVDWQSTRQVIHSRSRVRPASAQPSAQIKRRQD